MESLYLSLSGFSLSKINTEQKDIFVARQLKNKKLICPGAVKVTDLYNFSLKKRQTFSVDIFFLMKNLRFHKAVIFHKRAKQRQSKLLATLMNVFK